jgi:hypothetical protein
VFWLFAMLFTGAIRILAQEPAKGSPSGDDVFAGVRFIRGNPALAGTISLDLFAVLFGGAIALLPAIAQDRLGVGAVGLGWLRAAIGIGAGAVTLFLTVRPVRRHVGRTLLAVVALFGVGSIVLGATTSFAVAFVALLVLSGADSVSVFIRSTLVPLVTPFAMRGRVLAVESVSSELRTSSARSSRVWLDSCSGRRPPSSSAGWRRSPSRRSGAGSSRGYAASTNSRCWSSPSPIRRPARRPRSGTSTFRECDDARGGIASLLSAAP